MAHPEAALLTHQVDRLGVYRRVRDGHGQSRFRHEAAEHAGSRASATCTSPNLERATAAATKAGHQPKQVRDFREVLADKSIDVVCIATPDHWHAYMTVEACKDVYVEKPMPHGPNRPNGANGGDA